MPFTRHLLPLTTLLGGLALPVIAQPSTPPLPAPSGGPVEFFRNLLDLREDEREAALADRAPEQRALIRAKIDEYLALPDAEREARLRATQLRWYLMPLMRTEPDRRDALLAAVPEADRELVSARLVQWDRLSEADQQAMLENEPALNYLTRPEPPPLPPGAPGAATRPAPRATARNDQLHAALERWSRIEPEQQRRVFVAFGEFFALPPETREQAVRELTDAERAQMDATMQTFADMPAEQRRQCLVAFQRLLTMSGAERTRFLRSAEEWGKLSASERDAWRDIVHRMPPLPPLPGRYGLPPLPQDTVPSRSQARSGREALAVTNGR